MFPVFSKSDVFKLCTCPWVDEQLHTSKMIYTAWVFNWHFLKSVVIIFIYPSTAARTPQSISSWKTIKPCWFGLVSAFTEGGEDDMLFT